MVPQITTCNKDKFTIRFLMIVGLLLWLYSILKAWKIPINGDEIYTYEYYVKKGVIFLTDYNYIDANNHLLNTWLIELVYKIFGDHDFIIRIPNLLAQVLFLIYSDKLAMRLSTRVLTILAFLILNLNPYINDYFMLARGYGISMALMMASLYFAYLFITEKKDVKSAFQSMIFAALALLANFTLLNYLIILAILLFIIYLWNNKRKKTLMLLRDSLIILSPLTILIVVIPILFKLKNAHALYAGGYSTDFWKYTVVSIIKMTFDNTPIVVNYTILFEIFIIAILIVVLLLIFYKIRTKNSYWKSSFLVFIFVLIIFCAMENILLHLLIGINYLYQRTAMMYIPLFSLLMIFLVENSYVLFKKITLFCCAIIFIVMTINFIHVASLDRVIQHVWSPDLRDMLHYIKDNHKDIPKDKLNLSIGTNLESEQDLNDYIATYKLTWLNRVDANNEFNPLNDYYFIKKKDLFLLTNIHYSIIKEFPKSEMLLIDNKTEWKHVEIMDKKVDSCEADSSELIYIIDDSLLKYNYSMLNYKAIVLMKNLTDVKIITTIERGTLVYYYSIKLFEDYMVIENNPTQIYISQIIPRDIKAGDIIKIFIQKKMPYPIYLKDMEMRIVSYY